MTRTTLTCLPAAATLLLGPAAVPASAAPASALDTFKLQLPTGSNGNVNQISRDRLVAGYTSTYFGPTPDGQGWRMHTPSTACTPRGRTPAPNYARSTPTAATPHGTLNCPGFSGGLVLPGCPR